MLISKKYFHNIITILLLVVFILSLGLFNFNSIQESFDSLLGLNTKSSSVVLTNNIANDACFINTIQNQDNCLDSLIKKKVINKKSVCKLLLSSFDKDLSLYSLFNPCIILFLFSIFILSLSNYLIFYIHLKDGQK